MEEIIDYVMKTPENTNGNILREKLQKMGGSGGGVFVVGLSSPGTLDKTAREIMDAMLQKSVGLYVNNPSMTAFAPLSQFRLWNGSYEFAFGRDKDSYRCSSENDYPVVNN